MRQSDLQPRKRYAYRATASRNDLNLIKVTVVGPGRGRKVGVRYDDGELAGLDEWVAIVQLVCPWSERKAFLADHARQQELEQASNRDYGKVIEDAISTVMTASGEENGFTFIRTTDAATARRLWSRAGLKGSPLDDHPANYADRHGTWHLSFATAERGQQGLRRSRTRARRTSCRGVGEAPQRRGFPPRPAPRARLTARLGSPACARALLGPTRQNRVRSPLKWSDFKGWCTTR